jgi:hypothetical protein
MCKNNIDNIKGRVLLQVYPNEAYDHQAVLDSARAYAREFKRVGIPQVSNNRLKVRTLTETLADPSTLCFDRTDTASKSHQWVQLLRLARS